jgi:hypothetical protein
MERPARKPPAWTAEPEAYLGSDGDGRTYWLLGGHVYSYQGGRTHWLCPLTSFNRLAKQRAVKGQPALASGVTAAWNR